MSSRCPVTLSLALNRHWSGVLIRCNYGNAFPSSLTHQKNKKKSFYEPLQLLPEEEDSIAGLFWLKQARRLNTCFASRQYKGVNDRWKCQNISRGDAIRLDSSSFGILKWDVKDNSLAIIPFSAHFDSDGKLIGNWSRAVFCFAPPPPTLPTHFWKRKVQMLHHVF